MSLVVHGGTVDRSSRRDRHFSGGIMAFELHLVQRPWDADLSRGAGVGVNKARTTGKVRSPSGV